MTVEQIYERHIKLLTMAEKLKLLAMIAEELATAKGLAVVAGRRVSSRKTGGLPKQFFRPLILKALAQLGGRGRVRKVLSLVYQKAKPHLKPVDKERLPSSGDYRWRNKAQWERLLMVRDGLLRNDSPQGIWELTDLGWQEARKLMEGEASQR